MNSTSTHRRHWARLSLLLAAFLTVPLLAGLPAPAQAAGCYGVDCDNGGPKANGCMGDDKVIASGGGTQVQLRFSPVCKAFFAYSAYSPNFWDVELHLEMRKKVDGVWKVVKRITTVHEVGGEQADWTNMLGGRTSSYQFRAIWYDPYGGGSSYTPWAAGGNR